MLKTASGISETIVSSLQETSSNKSHFLIHNEKSLPFPIGFETD